MSGGMRKRKGIGMGKRPAARRCGAARTGTTAQRVLLAQGVLLGAVTLALFVQELPGIVREVRIWRMSNLRSGAKRPR
jgi:hypothetical protein